MLAPSAKPAVLVLDTHIVLDLFAFEDARAAALHAWLREPGVRWLATAAMREELARVLHYPAMASNLQQRERTADAVLARFDAHATRVETAPAVRWRCRDADDQKFIDLAVQRRALLLSRDKEVLRLKKRLAALGVCIQADFEQTSKQ
ncbi:putative toxin-antitoxin system toxin component, PIN family [Comamonas sp. NLF-1-9]|uniref:putative toxin-antitoxin system toxin component, PIN family n=1 Tax=Comamonas sp. NLF-1-9 TaxID=2853163 RepID=UPI001C47C4BD|nr:putative toxin-antitoxin system toxin component, PIN family [Comamonas sp. NLF-1-9]QXL83850.1 putative toxin-antitoxin system toxin component, PIN family [Comamonas sp. NLF-1-9]